MIMKTRQDQAPFTTGIRTELLFPVSQLLSSIITFGVQPNKAIVGRNAFAHEAGIHQDGYLKEKTTYEIIDRKTVGVPEAGRPRQAQRTHALPSAPGAGLRPDQTGARRSVSPLHGASRTAARRAHGRRRSALILVDRRSSRQAAD
jgi:hypothetical protein